MTLRSMDRKGYDIHHLWISRQLVRRQEHCYLKAIAMATVKRQKLMFLLPPSLDVKNQSCSSFFLNVSFFSPNSSAVGTPSLETGKHLYRLITQQEQFI